MQAKKSSQANLESKRAISLLLGLVVALSAVYIALEWSGKEKVYKVVEKVDPFIEFVVIPQTMPERPKTPLPPINTPKNILPPIVPVNPNPVDGGTTSTGPVDLPSPEPDDTPSPVGPPYVPVIEADPVVDFLPDEDMPKFPGNVLQFLAKNIRYPVIDQEYGIEGKVICQFVVDKDGSIIDIKVVRSVSSSIDKEAVRVIQSMPKWTPGRQHGKAVKVRYTLPINFTLKKI